MTEKNSPSNYLVVIPAHNEEDTIYEVVTRALCHADVTVVDDGSRDRTPKILDDIYLEVQKKIQNEEKVNNLKVITHRQATHIPKGIQDGIRFGTANGYEYVITMDAGLSHDPDALPKFIQHNHDIDIVIGCRKYSQNVPLYRKVISRTAAFVVNYSLTKSYFEFHKPMIADCTSGYRRAACELIAETNLVSKAFDFHMEALALCARKGLKLEEIPISYDFSNSSFNKNVFKQGIKFGLYLIATKKLNK
jgi:dolichol-phosphate mannosyltransferase